MTNIEQKALALVNEALSERHECLHEMLERDWSCWTGALCRAIERHEAFRQEVSDVVEQALSFGDVESLRRKGVLSRFIIPKPKPDPLVEVVQNVGLWAYNPERNWAGEIRAALDALGFEIREKNNV